MFAALVLDVFQRVHELERQRADAAAAAELLDDELLDDDYADPTYTGGGAWRGRRRGDSIDATLEETGVAVASGQAGWQASRN